MLFLCMGQRCFSYLGIFFLGFTFGVEFFLIINFAIVNYFVKFLLVDFIKAVVIVFSVKMQIRVRNGYIEYFNLWNGVIYETLAEFVVGETFDFLGEIFGVVWRVIIVWFEYY